MTMLKSFTCTNFRNITIKDLRFKKINLLIGPNNSGKSNFIKALTFFSDIVKSRGDVNLRSSFLNTVSKNHWDHMLSKTATNSEISFEYVLNMNRENYRYSLSFNTGDKIEDFTINLEELTAKNGRRCFKEEFNFFRCHEKQHGKGYFSLATAKGNINHRCKFDLNPQEILFKQYQDILLSNNNVYEYIRGYDRVNVAEVFKAFENYFRNIDVFESALFNTTQAKMPVPAKTFNHILESDVSNFINVCNYYKSDLTWMKEFAEKAKGLLKNLDIIDIVTEYDKLAMKLLFKDNLMFHLDDMSEGTLKALILNFIINMREKDEKFILTIDEPECNLHPAWQKVVGNWIQESPKYQQYFISTHSPDFLDVFTEEFKRDNVAVFVFEELNNISNIRNVSYKMIEKDLDGWELGDLYRVNDPALGGWPW